MQGDSHEAFCTVRSVRYCLDDGVHFVRRWKTGDLCEANLQKINNAKSQYQTSSDLNARVSASVSKAQALKAQGRIDDCLAETQQTLLDIQKATGDTKK